MQSEDYERKLARWIRLEEEARKIRRSEADWKFIEEQPARVKAALKYYVETGDIRTSSRMAEMSIDRFRKLLRQARIPVIV